IGLGLGLSLNGKSSLILPEKLIMPEQSHRYIKIEKDGLWVGWLARLVASSLVQALSARIVEKYTDDCICDENSCWKSPSNYSNANGIYGFNAHGGRFVTQEVNDYNVSFNNVSVPFLNQYNSVLGNVEGPFLAGLCWAADSMREQHESSTVRDVLIPTRMQQNGGYRFDTDACTPTQFRTNYGSTEIAYRPTSSRGGEVSVVARDKYDNLGWSESYSFDHS
ncbi:MAG: hypothetical protein AAGH79_15785, partial [Bacteroidota bacterium]